MEDRNQIAYRRFATFPERGTDIPTTGTPQTPPLEALRRIERIEHLYPLPGKQKDAQFAPTEPRAHALGPKGSFQRASRDGALGQTSFEAAAKDGCFRG